MNARKRLAVQRRTSNRRPDRAVGYGASRRTRVWLLLAGLLLATLAAYQPAWHGGLLWDDDAHLTRSDLRGADGLRRIWFELGATQQYYPLVHSTFWLLHSLWGDDTLGYHLVNIVLHSLAAFLLAMILRRLAVPWPWLAAFVFALHPVHVESVAWIAELKNTLSGVLFLGAALAYLRVAQAEGQSGKREHADSKQARPARHDPGVRGDAARVADSGSDGLWWGVGRHRKYGLALGLFVLALLSKTVTASLPVLLLVVCWWQRGRIEPRRDVVPLAPFFVLAGTFGALTVWMERTLIGARGAEFGLTFVERGLVAGRAILFYVGKLFWPVDLIFIYPRWRVSEGVWWQYFYPACVIALLVGLWLWRRRSRAPLTAMLFFTAALSPALGFVNVFPFRYSFVADHFQYLASIGMITWFTGSVATLLQRWAHRRPWVPAAAAVVVVAPLALLTWHQSHDYTDAETLYRATIARDSSSWMAHNNLAVLKLTGSVDEAMAHLTEALKSNPEYPEAHNNRGLALQLLGRFDDAVAAHETALRLEPGFAEAYNNLGTALQKLGRYQAAIVAYREALRLRPDNPPGHANLGNTLLEMARFEEAISSYREALRMDPALANIHYNLATAFERLGRLEEALAEYGETVRIEPGSADAHSRMGAILEKAGRLDEAVGHYEASARLNPDSAQTYLALANGRYAQGDWQRAAAAYEAAIEREPGSADAHNNLGACLERLGRVEEAVTHYRETVRMLPLSVAARTNLRRATAEMGLRR